MLFGFDFEAVADFFSGSPEAGDAINAAAATQLIKTKPLIFMILSSFLPGFTKRCPQAFVKPRRGCPADFDLGDSRDVPVIRSGTGSRTRRQMPGKMSHNPHCAHGIAAGQRPTISSIMPRTIMMKRAAIVLFCMA